MHAAGLSYSSSLYTRHEGDWLSSDMADSAAVTLNPVGLSLWLLMLAKDVSLGLGLKTWTGQKWAEISKVVFEKSDNFW